MEFNRKLISESLYKENSGKLLFYYLAFQEKNILIDMLVNELNSLEGSLSSPDEYVQWKKIAKAKILAVFEDLSRTWEVSYVLEKINIDLFLDSLLKEDVLEQDSSWLYIEPDKFYRINLNFDPQQLFLPENFESTKYYCFYLMESLDYEQALKSHLLLDQLLNNANTKTDQENTIKKILKFWILRLKTFAFSRLKFGDQLFFLKNSLVEAVKMGFDLEFKIITRLSNFESAEVVDEQKKAYLDSILNNQEIVGNKNIFIGQNFDPKLENWIDEYQIILRNESTKSRAIEPGTFHILKFLDTNPHIKSLNKNEIDYLRKILGLYNSLLNFSVVLSDEKQEKNIPPLTYISAQKFPDTLGSTIDKTKQIVSNTDVKKVDLNEILGQGSGVKMSNMVEKSLPEAKKMQDLPKIKSPPIAPLKKPLPKVINMSDMANSANKVDQVQDLGLIRQEIETKKRQAQAMIEKKLEDLKKRKS